MNSTDLSDIVKVTAAMNFHFIFMGNRIKILKKADLTFEDTFVTCRP